MRLCDCDALNARIDKCVGIDGLGLEPVMAIRDIKALISVMPTIDAIPVEWLRDKMQKSCATDANPFGYVLAEWLEEQEARQ